MSEADATWQYMTGQMHPTIPALLERYLRDSDAVALDGSDIRYGPHPRQVFDFVAATAAWRGTLAYYHAGYWQSRDKAMFRFIAPALAAAGLDMALVNYPLCPDVTLPALVDAVRASVPAVLAQSTALGRGGDALTAAGHSAGGHIAVELALTDWGGAQPVRGVVGISGVYDLEPLVGTPLNDKLRLSRADARAASPLHRLRANLPPALFVAGGRETPAFQAQSARMHDAWRNAANRSDNMVVEGADHFSILDNLARDGALLRALLATAAL